MTHSIFVQIAEETGIAAQFSARFADALAILQDSLPQWFLDQFKDPESGELDLNRYLKSLNQSESAFIPDEETVAVDQAGESAHVDDGASSSVSGDQFVGKAEGKESTE